MLHDISRRLERSLARWPGDVEYLLTHSALISEGSSNNVGILYTSLHFGTHIDAPYHFIADGDTVEMLDLEDFTGVAAVVDATGLKTLNKGLFLNIDFDLVSIVLIKTGVWADNTVFPTCYPVIDDDIPQFLGERGVTLLGVDLPSVDKFDGDYQINHHALGRAGIYILESVDLSSISEGIYELFAFPLNLAAADGSPVRAVLRDIGPS